MILARVAGTVVATRKDERLEGFKLLVVRPVAPDGREMDGFLVAVDTVDAGEGELVLVVSGSSARMASGCADRPVDAAIAGIVDEVDWTPAEAREDSSEVPASVDAGRARRREGRRA